MYLPSTSPFGTEGTYNSRSGLPTASQEQPPYNPILLNHTHTHILDKGHLRQATSASVPKLIAVVFARMSGVTFCSGRMLRVDAHRSDGL